MTTQTVGAVLDDPVPRDHCPPGPNPGQRSGDTLLSALESLMTADVDGADRDAVAALVRRSRDVRGWLDAFDVRCVRRTNTLAQQGRSESGESLIGRDGNRSSRDARMTRLRADTCDLFLLFEQALTSGEISAGHVDVLGLALRDLTDDQRFGVIDREARLIDSARRMSVDDFGRHVRVQVADVVAELAESPLRPVPLRMPSRCRMPMPAGIMPLAPMRSIPTASRAATTAELLRRRRPSRPTRRSSIRR